MAEMQGWSGLEVGQTPAVWRPTLRGVLVLDGDQIHQLEGLAAAVWLVLDDGRRTGAEVLRELRSWHTDIDAVEVEHALEALAALRLVRS